MSGLHDIGALHVFHGLQAWLPASSFHHSSHESVFPCANKSMGSAEVVGRAADLAAPCELTLVHMVQGDGNARGKSSASTGQT